MERILDLSSPRDAVPAKALDFFVSLYLRRGGEPSA